MKGDQAAESLVSLALHPNSQLQDLGWRGLGQMARGRPWQDERARRLALHQLWALVPDRLDAGQKVLEERLEDLRRHFENLAQAVRNNDRVALERLRSEARSFGNSSLERIHIEVADLGNDPITTKMRENPGSLRTDVERTQGNPERRLISGVLLNVLRLEDWDQSVRGWLRAAIGGPLEGSKREGIDILVLAWTHRLEEEALKDATKVREHLPEMLRSLVALPDCLYYQGSVQAMHLAIRHEPQGDARTILRYLPELFKGERYPNTQKAFLGQEVVLAAMQAAPMDALQEMVDKITKEPERFAGLAGPFASLAS
jgi:hypothetical protein